MAKLTFPLKNAVSEGIEIIKNHKLKFIRVIKYIKYQMIYWFIILFVFSNPIFMPILIIDRYESLGVTERDAYKFGRHSMLYFMTLSDEEIIRIKDNDKGLLE